MPEQPTDPEKKLIIDEDWKSQVEAEKEAARHGADAEPSAAAQPTVDADAALPQANLSFLVGTLYVQGAMALGLIANPMTKKAEVRLGQAKHAINLLAVLQEKTEGNRTPEETEEIEAILYELRMTFVTVSGRAGAKG